MDGLLEEVDFHCDVTRTENVLNGAMFFFFSVVFLDVTSWNTLSCVLFFFGANQDTTGCEMLRIHLEV